MTRIEEVAKTAVTSKLEGQNVANIATHQERAITELEERLVREAVNAIKETKQAIAAIEKNDKDAAIRSIERAAGELDIILARDRDLALLPIDYAVAIVNMELEDERSIREIRREIKSAINFGYFAEARNLLNSLKSEIRVIVTCLPLASYPKALEQAVRLMNEDKPESAKEVLQLALATLILEEEYLPIPILKASGLIEDASNQSDKHKAMELLAAARKQLRLSQVLGYGEADVEYDELKRELADLEKQLKLKLKLGEHSHHRLKELKIKIANFFQQVSKAKKR